MNRIRKASAFAIFTTMLTSHSAFSANAPDHCYDFSNMAEGTSYTVGDVIETKFATITIKPYFRNGAPAEADNRRAEYASSQIAGGSSPELLLYVVALNVVPKKPVSRITTRIAQSIPPNGAFADSGIGVNKKGFKSQTGFAGVHGKVLGTRAVGKAKISADISPVGTGNWQAGTLEFDAVQGGIESIRLGGQSWRIDNMCFTL